MSMTTELEKLYKAFKDEKIDYAYNVFPTDADAPVFPYVTAFVTDGEGFMADDSNYYDRMNISVILFTSKKDPVTEDRVRDVIKSLGLGYTWDESYSTSEKVYAITYKIQMEA